ncbi:MAG: MFS transporter [Acidobacteriota bacterium]|nr:MFS transporter [Acidobacteriota bacterium]
MERKWWSLIVVCVAIFMLLLDITVVNVALPSIQRSLHASFQDLQWVVNAYSLTLAAVLLTAGALADLWGRRMVFVLGLAVFTASSALSGLSVSPLMLNLARGAQGIGGAMMFATSLALIAQAFHGKERGVAFGVFGAVTGGAVAIGPLIGGVITTGIGWEWIFFVNVPIGLLAILAALARVEESRDPNARGADWVGVVTFSGSLFLLVFALVQGNESGWGSAKIVGFLAGSAVLLALFIAAELAQERPMLDLSLFRRPAFGGASLVAFALSGSAFALFLFLTLYMQTVLGYSALQTGLRFLPTTLVMFAVSPLAGRLTVHVPVRLLLGAGLLFIAGGLLAMTAVEPSSGWTVLIPGFVLQGIGVGFVNPPLASTAIAVVPPERSGMASGINSTFRQVGIATGIAALGAIFQHELTSRASAVLSASGHAREALAALHAPLGPSLQSGAAAALARHLPAQVGGALRHAYRVGFVDAMSTILIIAAALALAGAALAVVMVRTREFAVYEHPGSEAPATGETTGATGAEGEALAPPAGASAA